MSEQTDRLLRIMAALRDPDGGCPWDREQDFHSIVPHTLEEAYEVAEAVESGDLDELRAELGDLLFQVVFHARLAEELGRFDFEAVAGSIADKLERRHPHVFAGADFDQAAWERDKAEERTRQGARGALDGVPANLPALTRASKLGKRAARVGFDWPDLDGVLDKILEERAELLEAIEAEPRNTTRVEEELGDLLFALTNLARHLEVDPERALRGTSRRFEQRFRHMETAIAAAGRRWEDLSLEELETYWQAAKN